MRVYIINGHATRKKPDDRSHRGYYMDMQLLQELFYNGNQINHLLFTEPIIFGLMNIIIATPYKKSTLQIPYSLGKILKVIFMIQTS